MSLKTFIAAYLECALWSSTYGENGEHPLDDGEHEWAPASLAAVTAEAGKWYAANGHLIDAADDSGEFKPGSREYTADEYAGHDFWLTRNGHGAGFWDGDWPEPWASQLDDAASAAREIDLYIGDDGLIYACGLEGNG